MKCIILAAGYATRMYPLTENFPKPLLEVGGKAILDWLVEDLGSAVDGFVVISNHKYAEHFQAWAEGKPVTVIDDGTSTNETRLGAVRDIQFAIGQAGLAGEDLLVIAGDNVLDFSLREFVEYAQKMGTSCTMRYWEDDENKLRRAGVSEVEGERLISFEEKPAEPKSHWCTPPFYYYRADDAAMIQTAIDEGCGTDAPGSLVAWMCRRTPMNSMVMPGKRYDIGNLETYEKIKREYKGIRRTYQMLIINPGSTSTKISLFENEKERFEKSRFHDAPVLLQYPHVNDQVPFRYQVILEMLKEEGVNPSDIDVFVGRGGSACTQPSGVTRIDQKLYEDTEAAVGGSEHAAKLGVMLAWRFSLTYGRPAYTLNPTNVDEYNDYARLTGIRGLYRTPHSHVLNPKAVAEAHAKSMGKRYDECNFIVAHIDGGVTVSAHDHGRMTDGTMGADGDGPFAPTRIGSVPVLELLDYIEAYASSEGGAIAEVRRMCSRSGGFVSLFGTSNSDTVHAMVEQGDKKAVLVWKTMIYQICKSIGAMSAVLSGKVDAILLTGGLMRFEDITEGIRERCGWIAPICVYPGEMEQEAMALPVLKVMRGEAEARTYSGRNVWNGFEGIEF